MEHGGVSNTLADVNRRCDVGANDRVLALSALYFDLRALHEPSLARQSNGSRKM
uniref:Uncharacterized protein n=1 Tax=Candidatus Kentrum sp. LPFa TaxID=2126335 RepID=A0A450WXZ0_9GAMM|nr:MAG: hypothetical protein BECKLPF1236A_GA0070988_103232 [Candidatus Kentron sp. LPFa]VFK35059.1 MAG: hypothetical protein BECKLPF1236C_GA0070990_103282 [Candidatus Kentron sp. LPFa]